MGISTVGATAIGTQAAGQLFSAHSSSQAAKYNAQIATQNSEQDLKYASQEAELGGIEASNSEQKTKAELGSIKANQGASGVTVGKGSFADIQGSIAEKGMLDAMTIRANAARAAYGYQVGAVNEQAQSRLDKKQAKNDMISGVIGAGSTVLGGYAKGVQSGTFSSDPWGKYTSGKSISRSQEQTLIDNNWQG